MIEKLNEAKALIDEGKLAEAKAKIDEVIAAVESVEPAKAGDDDKPIIGGGNSGLPIKK